MLSAHQILLRVLFFRDPHDPDVWNAQALERDIAAFGGSVEQAKRAFEATVSGYLRRADLERPDPLGALKPAPLEFFQAWNAIAQRHVAERRQVGAEWIPSVDTWMLPLVTYDPIPTAY